VTKITDLDALVPADRIVRIGGEEYSVPGDMPMETYLTMARIQQEQDALSDDDADRGPALIHEMTNVIVSLITANISASGRPEAEAKLKRLFNQRGIQFGMKVLGAIYDVEEDEAEDVPPTSTQEASETPTPSSATVTPISQTVEAVTSP
jgi:hypothetical protein